MLLADADVAFLQADELDELDVPPPLSACAAYGCQKLCKSMYGTRRASRNWQNKTAQVAESHGYTVVLASERTIVRTYHFLFAKAACVSLWRAPNLKGYDRTWFQKSSWALQRTAGIRYCKTPRSFLSVCCLLRVACNLFSVTHCCTEVRDSSACEFGSSA